MPGALGYLHCVAKMADRRRARFERFTVERRTSNRRAFPRWPARFEMRFGQGKELAEGHGREIGEGGISFESDHLYPLETEIDVEFRLHPEDAWVRVKAVVKHLEGRQTGAEFLNLKLHDRLKIVDFLIATKRSGSSE